MCVSLCIVGLSLNFFLLFSAGSIQFRLLQMALRFQCIKVLNAAPNETRLRNLSRSPSLSIIYPYFRNATQHMDRISTKKEDIFVYLFAYTAMAMATLYFIYTSYPLCSVHFSNSLFPIASV